MLEQGRSESGRHLGARRSFYFAQPPEGLLCPQVEEVFAAHQDVLTEARYRDSALQSIAANMKWLRANAPAACAWLRAAPPPGAASPDQAPAPAPGPGNAAFPGMQPSHDLLSRMALRVACKSARQQGAASSCTKTLVGVQAVHGLTT